MDTSVIENIYKNKESVTSTSEFFIPILIILASIIILIYLMSKSSHKTILNDWESQRCNPKYIFFSGFIHNTGKDPLQYTYDNFVNCAGPNLLGIPSAFTNINNTTEYLTKIVSSIGRDVVQIDKDKTTILSNVQKETDKVEKNVNSLNNSMDVMYNQHEKLSNTLKLYFERFFTVLNTITDFTRDMLYYKIFKHQQQMDAYSFLVSNTNTYNSLKGSLKTAQDSMRNLEFNADGSWKNIDPRYSEFIDPSLKARDVINRINALKQQINDFRTANDFRLPIINKACTQLYDGFSLQCNKDYPDLPLYPRIPFEPTK